MNSKRFLRCILFAALMIGLVPAAMMAAEGEPSIQVNGEVTEATNITIDNEGTNTITITGDVTLTGSGDAFTINADTELVFAEGASLTFTGYDNAFVIENGTLSGGGWHIIDGDGLDLFRLKTGSTLDITSDVDFDGNGVGNTASRAIVLPGGGAQDQVVIVANGATLHANDFYRGIETGAAQNYSVKGESKTGSTYDLSGNDCGIFINYGDRNAHYNNCTIDVKNCKTSGIFMHQHNASLNGLYIDNVVINCINDPEAYDSDGQENIAIRFHTVAFSITNSEINIENAWNTGLWIYDGWEKGNTKEIKNTTINVKHVEDKTDVIEDLFGPLTKRKAITLVPFGEWTIDGCTINIDGESDAYSSNNEMEGGVNIASDIGLNHNGSLNPSDWIATPGMYSGKIVLTNTSITTSGVTGADIGAQVGQWLEIGENVVINNEMDEDRYTALCDNLERGFPVKYIIGVKYADYNTQGMSETDKDPKRMIVTGGSYWSSDAERINFNGANIYLDDSTPINEAGENLKMFLVTAAAYASNSTDEGLALLDCNNEVYYYKADNASSDGNHYIWAPPVTVTFDNGNTCVVPRGAKFGLTQSTLPGNCVYNDQPFTLDTVVTGDMTVNVQ